MMMCQIAFSVPDEVLFDTKMSREQANQFARRYVALGFYKQNGVSIGYCSQIAGMTEEEFIKYLGQNEISIFQFDDKEEFLEELGHA
jgi:predicted HTH domain antitoxin